MNEFNKKPKFLTYPADKMENYLYEYVNSYNGKTSKYIKNYFGWDELGFDSLKNIYSGKAFRPSICILVCTSFSGTFNANPKAFELLWPSAKMVPNENKYSNIIKKVLIYASLLNVLI